ncbi:MAG TPA: hypothetical protein VJM12_15085 [Pyrinomonadaceae bacterium]|nr:hypothetical protein [Pyrinomonadaceae bacterium]
MSEDRNGVETGYQANSRTGQLREWLFARLEEQAIPGLEASCSHMRAWPHL